MSFDVFLFHFVDGNSSKAPREPVLNVLASVEHSGTGDYYSVSFPDGTNVEFSAAGLTTQEEFNGAAFHIRGFGRDLCQFMLEVLRAGDMVMIPAMEDPVVILASENQKRHLPASFAADYDLVVVTSPEEMRQLLNDGYGAWSAYRDQVVGKPDES